MWLLYVLVILLVAGIVLLLNSPAFKGYLGERSVGKDLKKAALKHGGLELKDLMLEDDHSSSQIDNVLLTQKALYVIEMKNYRGMIFGDEAQNNWTMTLLHTNKRRSRSGKVYKRTSVSKHAFYNPIRQNATHIRKIKNVCQLPPDVPIINIVVFGNRADLSRLSTAQEAHVVKVKNLGNLIAEIEKRIQTTISLERQIEIVDELTHHSISDRKRRKEHVRRLKAKYKA